MKDKFTEGMSDIEGSFFGEEKDQRITQLNADIAEAQGKSEAEVYAYYRVIAGDVVSAAPQRQRVLEADSATRKTYPMAAGLLDYFPDALAEVARVSFLGNQKHNPGQPLYHARGKSMDHADCIVRHLVGRGGFDGEIRESAALAWRALALLQEELERAHGLPLPRGAKGEQ